MNPAYQADLVVALHVAYVAFIVVGQLLILLGSALRWRWVRNVWFRAAHLTAIGIVAAEVFLSVECPLTRWELDLRQQAGEQGAEGSFLGRLLHGLILHEAPQRWFDIANVAFAVLVLGTLILLPPQWRRRRQETA
jgi:hypothetical protein